MSLTIPISARTIPQGVSVFGPVLSGAGFNAMELDLEIGALVAQCDFLLEKALDGVTWEDAAVSGAAHPPVDRQGNPIVPAIMRWNAGLGHIVDDATGLVVPILTTAITKVRLTINNTLAFVSQGGSIVVS